MSRVLLLLPLPLGFWRSDVPCFGAGPWSVARETVGQLRRCSQRRGEWVTQAAFSDTHPLPITGKVSQRALSPLDLTEVTLLILVFLERAASAFCSSDWWELARVPREGNGLRRPCPHRFTLEQRKDPDGMGQYELLLCPFRLSAPPGGKGQEPWPKRPPGSKPGIIIDGAAVDFCPRPGTGPGTRASARGRKVGGPRRGANQHDHNSPARALLTGVDPTPTRRHVLVAREARLGSRAGEPPHLRAKRGCAWRRRPRARRHPGRAEGVPGPSRAPAEGVRASAGLAGARRAEPGSGARRRWARSGCGRRARPGLRAGEARAPPWAPA